MQLLVATTNPGKLAELAEMLGDGWTLRSPRDFPGLPDVPEEEPTLEGNALVKARTWAARCGGWALGDDSGLEVDALGGAPGVRSARYDVDDQARIARLLRALEGVPPDRRTARFRCVLALADPTGVEHLAIGTCEGVIAAAPRGEHGFGYDPVFQLADGRTLAELTRSEKAAVSHRGQALRALRAVLGQLGR